MTISYIGSATGTTSATIPTHQAGDLIILFAYRDGSTTAPTNPGFTFSDITTVSGSTNSARVAWCYATGAGTTTGTWTNATSVVVHVYRGTAATVGAFSGTTGASTTVSYPALTMLNTDGTSWVAGFAGHSGTTSTLETAPTGMTNRATVQDATDEAAGHDTNGAVSSWSLQTVNTGLSGNWVGFTVEILDQVSTGWSFVALGTQSVVASGDVAPGEPTGAAQGDLLVAYLSARGSASFTLPSGWSLIGTQQTSGNIDVNLTTSIASGLMAYIVRGSSAPSLTFTRTGGDLGIGRIIAYRPPSGATPILDQNTVSTMAAAGTAVSVSGFTTTKDYSLICLGLAGARSMGASDFDAATAPTSDSGFSAGMTTNPTLHAWVERHDEGWTTGADGSLAFADAVQKTAGATGNLTTVAGLSARHVVMAASFYLRADGAYSSDGVATVSGVGSTAGTIGSGAFASAGAATVSATGAATAASAYSSSGVATISGVGRSTHAAVYSSSGVATPTGVGSSVASSAYSSAGVATINGVMTSTHAAVYSAVGAATGASSGASTAGAVFAVVAGASASGTGISTAASAYSSSGVATVSGSSSTSSVQSGAYSSDGVATVSGVGRSTAASTGASSASAAVSAASVTFGGGSASSGGTSTVVGIGAAIGAGTYSSNGSSTATASSPTDGSVSYGTGGDEVVDLFIPARVATDDGEVAKRTG